MAMYTTKVFEFLFNKTLVNLYLLINSTFLAMSKTFVIV